MKNKTAISFVILPLMLIAVFSIVAVSYISEPNQINDGLTKYGQVCISTTGHFEGRTTEPHSGEMEIVKCDHNLVVDEGLNAVRDILGQGTDFGAFDVIALCNATAGCSAPAAGDTNVENEYTTNGLARASATYGTLGTGNWSIYHTFTSSGIAGLETNKTCLVNQTTVAGDTLFACNTFNLVTLDGTAGDTVLINWTNFVESG